MVAHSDFGNLLLVLEWRPSFQQFCKIDSFDFDACSRELAVEFMKM